MGTHLASEAISEYRRSEQALKLTILKNGGTPQEQAKAYREGMEAIDEAFKTQLTRAVADHYVNQANTDFQAKIDQQRNDAALKLKDLDATVSEVGGSILGMKRGRGFTSIPAMAKEVRGRETRFGFQTWNPQAEQYINFTGVGLAIIEKGDEATDEQKGMYNQYIGVIRERDSRIEQALIEGLKTIGNHSSYNSTTYGFGLGARQSNRNPNRVTLEHMEAEKNKEINRKRYITKMSDEFTLTQRFKTHNVVSVLKQIQGAKGNDYIRHPSGFHLPLDFYDPMGYVFIEGLSKDDKSTQDLAKELRISVDDLIEHHRKLADIRNL
jgi:hypothetical protein